MTRELTVAVLGATGVVGREMVRVLEQRAFPVRELRLLASPRSAGESLSFRGVPHTVRTVTDEAFRGVDVALFSAGSGPSREWAPRAAAAGAVVIDNSSAWRMDPEVPLVVPEVNPEAARVRPKGIIANPNCSTIQMVVVLKPLHDEARVTRVVVSSYQAVSGKGQAAVDALRAQQRALAEGTPPDRAVLGGQLAENVLMHWSRDAASGYQDEELKMIHETRKILGAPALRVSPTTVRVPVICGHAESVALELAAPLSPARARALLAAAPGVRVVDDFAEGGAGGASPPGWSCPTPLDAAGGDDVLVGRIREDLGNPGGLLLWIVGDNLRKGAALNAVQIAEALSLA